ncbi:MAG: hypothetical protein MUP14_04795, partial [Dehalococcoidia bacterium]|nr:hypothetical protein [Dehalococcoidia bacterium]
MRRLAIMTSIIGAVAFAALLAWGLTIGSGAAKAATPTPTATTAATATAAATPTVAATATAAATAAATATAAPIAGCDPVIPTPYTGTVMIGGQPVPDGTTVTAHDSTGQQWATDSTSGGKYVLTVPATMPAAAPCFTPGTVTFKCGSVSADQNSTQATGVGAKDLNLTCGGAAAASPTAQVTPKPSPTVAVTPTVHPTVIATAIPTPTVPPYTGVGGMGGDGSFMWWPLALAA